MRERFRRLVDEVHVEQTRRHDVDRQNILTSTSRTTLLLLLYLLLLLLLLLLYLVAIRDGKRWLRCKPVVACALAAPAGGRDSLMLSRGKLISYLNRRPSIFNLRATKSTMAMTTTLSLVSREFQHTARPILLRNSLLEFPLQFDLLFFPLPLPSQCKICTTASSVKCRRQRLLLLPSSSSLSWFLVLSSTTTPTKTTTTTTVAHLNLALEGKCNNNISTA